MRLKDLFEAQSEVPAKYWINANTGEIILVDINDPHGESVFKDPQRFGISNADIERIQHVVDNDPDNDEDGNFMFILVRYEAQKNGWCRAGSGTDGWRSDPFIYAASVKFAQKAAQVMYNKGWITDTLVVEITDPSYPDEGYGPFYQFLDFNSVKNFVQRGVLKKGTTAR